jgi:hypothetical protein
MKQVLLVVSILIASCSCSNTNNSKSSSQMYTESEILELLDKYFLAYGMPFAKVEGIDYPFFPDLEHGYCETAGSRIHLFADAKRWAVVFEKSGYQNRGFSADIELDYFGNCITYPVEQHDGESRSSNAEYITLIDANEFERVEDKGEESFELIAQGVKEITVRGQTIPFESDPKKYYAVGIKIREDDNPRKLIGFEDFVRYLHETNPGLISATEDEIRKHMPKDLPRLMIIQDFHFHSTYDKSKLPSTQELYQLIAKTLVSKDISNWRPTLKPNNHWSNWESGNL